MIDPSDKKLSIRKQAKLLGINRNRLAARPTKTSEEDLKIMAIMDALHMECPFYGQRNFRENLKDHGYSIGRKRVRRLMHVMGIESLVPKPSTSIPAKGHKIFPYLLRNRDISAVDEVWCADITYLPMEKGHAYLVAIMDWHSRAVLAWEISNTMDSAFCVRTLRAALRTTGRKPKIFNTDQGSQFTGADWISELQSHDIQISMDGRGRWMDNVFIERLWRSLKYEKLRLWSYQTIPELRALTASWMEFYNHRRKHQSHGYGTPWSVYDPPACQAA
jgi:putative transposase